MTGDRFSRYIGATQSMTPDWRIKRAIMALGSGASLMDELSEYANKNTGRRIVDVQQWTINYMILVGQLKRFALCLVDNRQ
jgi:hypothetical protein